MLFSYLNIQKSLAWLRYREPRAFETASFAAHIPAKDVVFLKFFILGSVRSFFKNPVPNLSYTLSIRSIFTKSMPSNVLLDYKVGKIYVFDSAVF